MKLEVQSPLDMHLHLRDGNMLKLVAPLSAESLAGAVIMPNLVPPVTSVDQVVSYKERIMQAVGKEKFQPLMTAFFKNYTEQELLALKDHVFGLKLYPAGATTNSEGGVQGMDEAEPTIRMMEEMGIPLLVHGESHGFVMDREAEFLAVYRHLAEKFPKLTISMEHITTASAVKMLDEYENLVATVTLQHLLITLDDVAGGMLKPHLFCKPIAKRPADKEALLEAALNAHSKLMFGSDSAPHPIHAKESCGCAAGVFTGPIALPKLAEVFEKHGKLNHLQAFVSDNACRIYSLQPISKIVVLEKKDMIVPKSYEGYGMNVVPMDAGDVISWSVKK